MDDGLLAANSTNWAQHRVTMLIKINKLSVGQAIKLMHNMTETNRYSTANCWLVCIEHVIFDHTWSCHHLDLWPQNHRWFLTTLGPAIIMTFDLKITGDFWPHLVLPSSRPLTSKSQVIYDHTWSCHHLDLWPQNHRWFLTTLGPVIISTFDLKITGDFWPHLVLSSSRPLTSKSQMIYDHTWSCHRLDLWPQNHRWFLTTLGPVTILTFDLKM